MGVQIVTEELRTDCALLVEDGEETLQNRAHGRTTLEQKHENRRPQTEQKEVGDRSMILRIATANYIAIWLTQPLFKEASVRANNFHEATPGEVDRMEQLLGDHYILQKIRLFRWGRIISDITYGPARAVNVSRRMTQQLAIYGRWGVRKRIPLNDNDVVDGIPPLQKRTDRRICHRQTHSCARIAGYRNTTPMPMAIPKENQPGHPRNSTTEPYGRQPTCKDLREEVNAFSEHINYDSDQEDAKHQANVRKSIQAAYEKRQEMRRQVEKHSCVLRK